MKIKNTVSDEDIEFLYDCLIFTTIAEAIIIFAGMALGVC